MDDKKTLAEQLEEENKGVEFAEAQDNPDNLYGLATKAQIAKWRKKYDDGIFGVKSDGHVAYFRHPTRAEISDALKNASADDVFGAYTQMSQMTFIGGSVNILTSDRLYASTIHLIKQKIDGDAEVLDF